MAIAYNEKDYANKQTKKEVIIIVFTAALVLPLRKSKTNYFQIKGLLLPKKYIHL